MASRAGRCCGGHCTLYKSMLYLVLFTSETPHSHAGLGATFLDRLHISCVRFGTQRMVLASRVRPTPSREQLVEPSVWSESLF